MRGNIKRVLHVSHHRRRASGLLLLPAGLDRRPDSDMCSYNDQLKKGEICPCRSTPFSAAPLLMFHFQITSYLEYQRFSKDLLNSQYSTTTETSSVSRKVLKQVKELMRLVGTPENQKFEHKYKIGRLLPNQPSLAWISVMLSPFSIILPKV